jgi:4-diphosphocytidyl-2-C-methyl-D-erythritol kinase
MDMPGAVSGARIARAKVNLFLHVGEKREDGFHPLQSLAVFTELGDALEAREADGLSLSVTGPFADGLQNEPDNLVLKAARALAVKAGRNPEGALALIKNLPVASGIGGGSADAAAALRALAALWRLDIDDAGLSEIALALGSDIPVCVANVPSFMAGRGEIVTPVESLPHVPLLLVNPKVAVPTKDVFAALGKRSGVEMKLPRGRFRDSADLLRFLDATHNDLQEPACGVQPVIRTVLGALAALPGALFSRMSGSGATCFALFPDDESCRRAAALLAQKNPSWWIAPTFVPEFNIEHEDAGQDIGPTPDGL